MGTENGKRVERMQGEEKTSSHGGTEELVFHVVLQPEGHLSSLVVCSWCSAAPAQSVDCSLKTKGGSYLGVGFNSLSRHVYWENLGQS